MICFQLGSLGMAGIYPVFVGAGVLHQAWAGFWMSELFDGDRGDQLQPLTARITHFKFALLCMPPIVFSAVTGMVFTICKSWFRIGRNDLLWLARLHTMRNFGGHIFYPFIAFAAVLALAMSGIFLTYGYLALRRNIPEVSAAACKRMRPKKLRKAWKMLRKRREKVGEP